MKEIVNNKPYTMLSYDIYIHINVIGIQSGKVGYSGSYHHSVVFLVLFHQFVHKSSLQCLIHKTCFNG